MRRLLSTLALAALLPLANPLPSLAQAVPPGMASLVADRVQILGDGLIVAQGNVAVLYGDARLTASRITYDRAADSLQIEGPLTLAQGDSILLLADAAQLSTDLREGLMTSARVGHAIERLAPFCIDRIALPGVTFVNGVDDAVSVTVVGGDTATGRLYDSGVGLRYKDVVTAFQRRRLLHDNSRCGHRQRYRAGNRGAGGRRIPGNLLLSGGDCRASRCLHGVGQLRPGHR